MAKRVRIQEIKPDCIIVLYGIQTMSLHDYGNRNSKWTMKRAVEEIGARKYMELGSFISIARRNNMTITSRPYYKNSTVLFQDVV